MGHRCLVFFIFLSSWAMSARLWAVDFEQLTHSNSKSNAAYELVKQSISNILEAKFPQRKLRPTDFRTMIDEIILTSAISEIRTFPAFGKIPGRTAYLSSSSTLVGHIFQALYPPHYFEKRGPSDDSFATEADLVSWGNRPGGFDGLEYKITEDHLHISKIIEAKSGTSPMTGAAVIGWLKTYAKVGLKINFKGNILSFSPEHISLGNMKVPLHSVLDFGNDDLPKLGKGMVVVVRPKDAALRSEEENGIESFPIEITSHELSALLEEIDVVAIRLKPSFDRVLAQRTARDTERRRLEEEKLEKQRAEKKERLKLLLQTTKDLSKLDVSQLAFLFKNFKPAPKFATLPRVIQFKRQFGIWPPQFSQWTEDLLQRGLSESDIEALLTKTHDDFRTITSPRKFSMIEKAISELSGISLRDFLLKYPRFISRQKRFDKKLAKCLEELKKLQN